MPSSRFGRKLLRTALIALLLLSGAAALADAPVCSFCGREIRRGESYFKSDDGVYCSRDCAERAFEERLPVCSVCGGKCRGRYTVADGKNFCSEQCFESILPVCTVCGRKTRQGARAADGSYFACTECLQNPRCFICDIPAGVRTLADGRVVCRRCSSGAITDPGEAERCFRKVRNELKQRLRFYTDHRIEFALVDRPALHEMAKEISDTPRELGLFVHHIRTQTSEQRDADGNVLSRRTEKVSEDFRIYALDHLTREYLEYVCAHELAHDWQVANYPDIDDPAVREGFAEYIGWRYNRMHGRHQLNRRIENNTDTVYGAGFRQIKRIADREGFAGVRRFLKSKQRRNRR